MDIKEAKIVLEEIGLQDEVTDELVDASGIVLEHLEAVEVELAAIKPKPARVTPLVDDPSAQATEPMPAPMPGIGFDHAMFQGGVLQRNAGQTIRTVEPMPPFPLNYWNRPASREMTASEMQAHMDRRAQSQRLAGQPPWVNLNTDDEADADMF